MGCERTRPPPYSIWHETIIEEGVTWAEHQVHQGSIIDMLRKVGDRLAHRYGWAQAPALRFILTGHTPTIDPIRGETSRLRTGVGEPLLEEITLVVKPWLSEEAVVKMYREGQRRLLASENVRQRWKSPRNYRVFQFVIEHTDSDGQHQSAQKLMELWNEQHESVPEDQYHDRRNFWRDYKSGQVTLWM